MKIIIVESPNKCRTITKYLNNKYEVIATNGHIRDLAISGKDGLGVECENDFKPHYELISSKKKIIEEIKKKVKSADEVLLATDPDREGEAIAWHISEVLNLPKDSKRLEFHEITKEAIKESLKNPHVIDLNLVASQETRRILDRIIGFKLSKILQKTNNLKSAGRVQSAVFKIIVNHEKEIKLFKPEKYWEISLILKKNNNSITVEFYEYHNKKIELKDKKVIDNIIKETGKEIKVLDIREKIISIKPKQPLITSSLQQEAITKFNMPSFKVSKIAQELYEGIKIKDEMVGLVTYIRTDSHRLNDLYVEKTRKLILKKFGKDFLGKDYKNKKEEKNKKFVQDAHEAIRPTDNNLTPEKVKKFLNNDQYKIYKFIYERTLSSLMAPKKEKITEYIIGNNSVTYKISKTEIVFVGFEKIANNDKKNNNIDISFNLGDILKVIDIKVKEKMTKPPSHFSESTIIKTMEKEGIGRPSTYSSTITNLMNRFYVVKEKGSLLPTKNGEVVVDFLENNFPNIVNVKFTANLENDLDTVKNGKKNKVNIIKKIYDPFIKKIESIDKESAGICPECGHELKNIRGRKTGYFIGCSNYPNCTFTKKNYISNNEILDKKCPICGSFLVRRLSYKRKKYFIGCSSFPKCNYIEKNNDKKNKNIVK